MKILHTADLHIGRRLNDISLLEDQSKILSDIVDIAEEQGVYAVLLSGDLYDKSAPAAEAMTLFDSFLSRLTDRGVQVFAVSGNHDSEDRVEYFSRYLERAGVHIYGRYDGELRSFSLSEGAERATVHLLPFLKPHTVRPYFKDTKIETYEDAARAALSNVTLDPDTVNILLAHQFVTGAALSDSEELAVGGLDNVSAELFDAFDYVALGHIHRPQSIKRDTLRYSGSPLKYSISEAKGMKSVSLIDITGGGLSVSEVPLAPLRDVREISGYLDDILKMDYSEDFVKITLQDDIIMPDARVTLSTVFPNLIRLTSAISSDESGLDCELDSAENLTPEQLFSDFYRTSNGGSAPTPEMLEIIKKLFDGEAMNI